MDSQGNPTGRQQIVLYDSSLDLVAATNLIHFSQVGQSPGISDDGQIVVFYGNLTGAGKMALDIDNEGPGIFASIETDSGWVTTRVSGIAGNNNLDPGETFIDNNNNGLFDPGETEVGPIGYDADARDSGKYHSDGSKDVRSPPRSAHPPRLGVHGHHAGGQTLGQHGYSKDHRPDLRQMILAVVIDGDGRPVCSEMWPGNTADVTTLIPVIERLRRRFAIARVCVVADRGLISAETLAELEARRLLYILGVRERTDKLVRELVLDDPAPFVPLVMSKRGKQVDYEAKAVMLAGRRYIVCRNHQEAQKDAADRISILAALERQLAKGDKALVGNTGYRRYLKTISDEHFAIDAAKVEEEKKFDGIFVLRTNTDLNPLEAMLCYKHLWTVEQTFRTAKHLLATRPIFHKLDETIRGHVFCSFLALVLKKALDDRIAAVGRAGSWPEIIADLDSLTETEIEHDGKRFVARSAPRPAASLALRAVGVALPPTIRAAGETAAH